MSKPAKPTPPFAALAGRSTLALIALIALLEPALGHAQTCALLPPGRPSEGPPPPAAARGDAVEAVTRALSREGVTVIPSEDSRRRMLGEPFAECNALECGGAVVRSLGVDFAVLVTVWAPRATPTSVVVTLIGPSDSAAGDAPVAAGDVAAAALSALTIARQRWQASQMGFIVVRTLPEGADIEIDGRLIGQSPVRHLVMAGRRQLRVHLEGYEPHEQAVRVEATREQTVEFTLSPEASEASLHPVAASPPRTEPDVANWLIGGALVAGGVAALISPLSTLAVEGQCADSAGLPEGWCRSEASFGAVSGLLLGVGIAALAGGVAVLIAQPLQVTTTLTPDSARLEIFGTF